jgi:hypothetical protein
MININNSVNEQEIRQYIEQECSKIGPVQRVEVFLRPTAGAPPFAIVYMVLLEHRRLIADKFGGSLGGPGVIIHIKWNESSRYASHENLKNTMRAQES